MGRQEERRLESGKIGVVGEVVPKLECLDVTEPLKLSAGEVSGILSTKPCVGLRFLPRGNLGKEVSGGVELGDYMKISRPRVLEWGNAEGIVSDSGLDVWRELSDRMKIDFWEGKGVIDKLTGSGKFVDSYNRRLVDLVRGFVIWTFNKAGVDPDGEMDGLEVLSKVPVVEMIVPNSTSGRDEGYLEFEKNGVTRISADEIKAWTGLDDEDVKNIREIAGQDGGEVGARRLVEVAAETLCGKVVLMLRDSLVARESA